MNEILEALKAKYPGVSEAVLKVTANSMVKKGLSLPAVEETTLEQVVTAYGDYRATEAAKTALKPIETKPQPTPGGEQGQGGAPAPEAAPAWATELINQNKTFAAELAALKGEKVTTARKTQLDTTIAALPENLRAPYKRMALDDLTDEQFTALQAEVKTEVEGIVAQVNASGVSFAAPPAAPGGSQVTEATAEEAKALLAGMS